MYGCNFDRASFPSLSLGRVNVSDLRSGVFSVLGLVLLVSLDQKQISLGMHDINGRRSADITFNVDNRYGKVCNFYQALQLIKKLEISACNSCKYWPK